VHNFDAIKLSIVFIAKIAAMLGGESQLLTQKKMIGEEIYLSIYPLEKKCFKHIIKDDFNMWL